MGKNTCKLCSLPIEVPEEGIFTAPLSGIYELTFTFKDKTTRKQMLAHNDCIKKIHEVIPKNITKEEK